MKNKLICILLLVLTDLFGQDIFIKHYGNWSGQGNSVIIDAQGNFLLAGNRGQGGSQQFCLYKINSIGDTIWLKHYGGPTDDYANEIIPTIEGGYALVGYSNTSNTISCITLMKIQSSGNLTWSKSFGGTSQEKAYSIRQTPTGEYFIGGKKKKPITQDDFYLIKTNANGDTLWTKTYGGNANETINSIDLCSDGGVIMTGYTESFGAGQKDYYLIKVDNTGNVIWSKTYGYTLPDVANCVKQTSDGGFILAGYSNFVGTKSDIYVIKTNSFGDTLWTQTYSATNKGFYANDIIVTQDGGYALSGAVELWQFIPPSTYSAIRSDALLMKLSSSGQIQAIKQYSVATGIAMPCITGAYGNSIIQLPDESCVVGGSFFNCSVFETMLIKTFDIGPAGIKEYKSLNLKVFPNPSSDRMFFQLDGIPTDYSLTLFNLTGTQVQTTEYNLTNQLTIEKKNLTNGIYFFRLMNSSGQTYVGKIAFE